MIAALHYGMSKSLGDFRTIRRALVGSVVLVSVACLNDDLTGSSSINGTYQLRTINGSELPYVTSGSGANKTEMLDDQISFYEGGTYAASGHIRTTVNGQATDSPKTETGSYSFGLGAIIMRTSDNLRERRPQYNANTMTFVENGLTLVYKK